MTVEVYGVESSTYKGIQREQQDRRMARIAKVGRANIPTAEIEANALELVTRCVKTWNIQLNGEMVPSDRTNIEEVLTKFSWIRAQIEAGIFDTSNFFQS